MQQIFFMEGIATMDEKARKQILGDNAHKVEGGIKYLKVLSPEELDIKRETLTDNAITLSEQEDELTGIKAGYKAKMDPLRKANKELLGEIKTKQTQVEGTLYHIANHDSGMMETYDELGSLVSSRRLRPDEKQATLFNLKAVNS